MLRLSSRSFLPVLLGVVTLTLIHGYGITVEQDLTLTKSEKKALDMFREQATPFLDKDYKKNDLYLIKWLRAKKFNIPQALEMLRDDIKWRQENRMDEIGNENWDGFQEEYPIYNDGFAKDGKPLNFGPEWDLRKAAVSGKLPRLTRWLMKGREDVIARVRKLQNEGKNVTRWNFIFNFDQLNARTHLCVSCMPIYPAYVGASAPHYPETVDQVIIINAPGLFEVVLNVINPLLSEELRNSLQIYGSNKEVWRRVLLNIADPDQLPVDFGGTKVYNHNSS